MESGSRQGNAILAASAVVSAALVALAWAWLPFGLDHFDQGYVLSAASLFFDHPEEVVPLKTGGMWLALLPIAILLEIGGDHGLILVRLAAVPVALATTVAGCTLVRGRVTIPALLLIGACTHLIARSWRVDGFLSYPLLSAFGLAIGATLTLQGAAGERRGLLLAGGAVLGANVFVRMPNAAGLVLLGLPALAALLSGRGRGAALRATLPGVLGVALGVGAVGLSIAALGHAGFFWSALEDIGALAGAADSPYDPAYLALQMGVDTAYAAVIALDVLLIAKLGDVCTGASREPWWRLLLVVNGTWLVGGMLLAGVQGARVVPYALILGTLVLSIARRNASPADRCADAAALGVFLVGPLGAAAGVETGAAPGALFAAPVAVVRVAESLRRLSSRHGAVGIRRHLSLGPTGAAILGAGLVFAAITHLPATSRDNSGWGMPRASLVSVQLPGVALDPHNAAMYDALLPAIRAHMPEDGLLLVYPNMPVVYWLAGSRAYLGETWPAVRTTEFVRQRLVQAEAARHAPPLVVRAPADNLSFTWPSPDWRQRAIWLTPAPKWLIAYRAEVTRWRGRVLELLGFGPLYENQLRMIRENRLVLDRFLTARGYAPVWRSPGPDALELLTTRKIRNPGAPGPP